LKVIAARFTVQYLQDDRHIGPFPSEGDRPRPVLGRCSSVGVAASV
jgi:hypothetical protein